VANGKKKSMGIMTLLFREMIINTHARGGPNQKMNEPHTHKNK